MKKCVLFIILIISGSGFTYVNAQFLNKLKGKIVEKTVEKQLQPNNYILKKSGDIVQIGKKGKEKKVSEIGAGGIDTLFIEDPSIPVGRACHERFGRNDIKAIVSNNAVYLIPDDIRKRIEFDMIHDDVVSYTRVQGFMAQKPSQYGHDLDNGDRKKVTCVKLPDAVVIDGDDGEFCSYFARTNIKKIIFSSKIRKIGKGAFRDCSCLQEVVFPEGCEKVEIDPEAFAGCNALKAITVPNGMAQSYIDMGLPEALIVDGDATLNLKIELEKTGTILNKIPMDKLNKISSLTVIGFMDENDIEVLKECINLKKLDLSNAYTTLSEELQKKREANSAFLQGMVQAMGELSQKKYENGEISTVDNLQVQLFADLVKGSSNVKKASVGCVIPTGSFSGMKNLETVILPVRASIIESKAFQDCTNLKEVMLPPYLNKIGTGAFAFCKNLKSVAFPKTLISIGNYDQQHTYGKSAAASFVETGIEKMDFSNCSFESNAIDHSWTYRFHCKNLKVIKLPNTDHIDVGFGSDSKVICYVPSSVMRLNISDKIKEIYFYSPNPPYVEGGLSNCVIYVPQGSLTNYYAKFKGNGNTIKEDLFHLTK